MTIVVDLIDYHARQLQRRHLNFQMAVKGVLATFLERSDAVSKGARNLAAEQIRHLRVDASHELAPSEGGMLELAMHEVANLAEEDAALPLEGDPLKDVATYNGDQLDAAHVKIRDALRLDEDSVLALYRKIQLRAGMMSAGGTNPLVAMDIAKRGEIVGLQFRRVDRLNRAWSSDIYTRTVARHLLVSTYVETYLMALVSNGIDTAQIPGDAEHEPLVFSITGRTQGLPTLDEIRAEHFHPNAVRLVERAGA